MKEKYQDSWIMMRHIDLVIGILTHNRPTLLSKTIESLFNNLIENRSKETTILLYDNGSDEINAKQNLEICHKYMIKYEHSENSIPNVTDNVLKDRQIARGHYSLISRMLGYNSEIYLLLEDDWKCLPGDVHLNFNAILQYFFSRKDIGQLRLRDCKYDGTITGCSSNNFVTNEVISFHTEEIVGNYAVSIGNLHWVNNPSLINRKALELVAKKFKDEIQCMEHFHLYYPLNAQLVPGIFQHIGPWRQRDDLIARGFICDDK